ncbi:MAG TPA: class I SAM-dependent methyltransferase [Steroidobacteraceae bacterium]|nr:class I SAM-dependent methyltransferase [Steroidobacteraceae bacterium]
MRTSEAHYQALLGPIYSWMLGDLDAAFARSAAELDALPLPATRGVAVDLGAGLGLHALPLARRGFQVVAIDNSRQLLDELRARCGSLAIATHHADILEFRAFLTGEPAIIVCMGDTLTHLSAVSAVESLLQAVAESLPRGGVFAATFRDYASRTLEGDQRFISVRADDARILTCFLEYQDQHVVVHDLVHEKKNDRWHQSLSSYPKLRLAPEWVASRLSELGFSVKRDMAQNGMARIVAMKN